MKRFPEAVTRREFVTTCTGTLAAAACLPGLVRAEVNDLTSHQATGTRVGEITENRAVVWTRLTAATGRNNQGQVIEGRAQEHPKDQLPKPSVPVEQLEGACPGMPGKIRLRYGIREDLSDAETTAWESVDASSDFTHHFDLNHLKPATTYHYESQTTDAKGSAHAALRGSFQTAPTGDAPTDLCFCVMTCQGYPDRGHPDGHSIYPSMLATRPAFTCLTGDLVYYDNDLPRAETPELARYHWQRMFSLPRLMEFCSQVSTYWLKDDHDCLNNDSWPGERMGSFTFDEGQKIFRQQAPMTDGLPYRTFRWGHHLQIWLTEGRDFRSPNNMADGPDKTIWGKEQKAWFKKTVKESDATWKILITPTPLIGPDRAQGKSDNHSNQGFAHEGNEIRNWLKENVDVKSFLIISGDRHWQYYSVDPATGLQECCPGAASDEHAGGSPGFMPEIHKFHRVKGGFISVKISRDSLMTICFHDIKGEVVFTSGWNRVG